jgi:hypothetical protein
MTGTEVIESAFGSLQISSNTMLLTQRIKRIEATSDQLVGIGLVTNVPTHLVPIQIERLIQSKGEFNDTEPWPKVSTTGRNNAEMAFPDLTGNVFELSKTEAVQLVRMLEISEMHAQPAPCCSIYGFLPF